MTKNNYYIYAKRQSEKNWSSWSQSETLDMAMLQCEKIRLAGFLAKIINSKAKTVVVEDE